MSGDVVSDEEGSQEDSARYDIDDMEIVKTIGKSYHFIIIGRGMWN